jgi:hypothetical protein
MSDDWNVEPDLKPLKVKCTSSDCPNGQHAYKPTTKQKDANTVGHCRSCDEAAPFDWERLKKLDPEDIDYMIASLKNELIRLHYWTNEIPQHVENYARRKGHQGMEIAIEARIRKSVGLPANHFDGRQTPVEDSQGVNAIHFAQHATAWCCRKCIEYWYGIPQDRSLTDLEISYLSKLGMRYINERFSLTEMGERIPPISPKSKKPESDL